MATKGSKYLKKREVAKLVTEDRQPCIFCNEDVDDEVIYGKLYALGDIQCHYFCVLLSCCLVQKGRDTEGLFGFLYKDIITEVERSKKHKCSYCGRGGASLGCSVSACRKQFHLPCGRRKNAVSLFYGNYKSFCELHAPKQKISESVMAKARHRMKREKFIRAGKIISNCRDDKQTESSEEQALVCVICYEDVQAYPTTQTFWPPCCGRDAWLHRSCLQRMALSAGMHYLKCPLCNDKEHFYDAVCDQGYYLPDRDAAWELEQNAFAEIYYTDAECGASECKCPFGRRHDEAGMWDIKLCLLCGSWGVHALCSGGERALCPSCRPAASDIEQLETRLTAVSELPIHPYAGPVLVGDFVYTFNFFADAWKIPHDVFLHRKANVMLAEQALETRRAHGPRMPSRMSLRRTKGAHAHSASSSSQNLPALYPTQNNTETPSPTKADRLELNLKTPRRPKLLAPNLKELGSALLSPIKMLEQGYMEKGGGGDVVVTNEVIEKIRLKFSKPRPLSAKKKIVNEILDDLFKNVFKENHKSKDPVKEWHSPRKSCDVTIAMNEDAKEISEPILDTNVPETGATGKVEKPKVDVEDPTADVENVRNNHEENSNKHNEDKEKEKHLETDGKSDEKSNILDDESSKKGHDSHDNDGNCNESVVMTVNDNDDESSRSTFQLPSEFIAESEDSLPILDTPKKLKTVEMKQDSSIEISENNETLNIDVVQIGSGKEKEFIKNLTLKTPVKNSMFSFKFIPLGKEPLQIENADIDVETFKDKYLNEVDRDKSSINHLKNDETDDTALRNIDINIESAGSKRKLDIQDVVAVKKRKKNREGKKRKLKIKIKPNVKKIREKKKAKMMKRIKELKSGKAGSIKIKLKEGKIRKSKLKIKSYKQYVLKYSPLQTNKVIAKPEVDVTPMKRKYTKQDKSPDNLVQTSIQSFFKAK